MFFLFQFCKNVVRYKNYSRFIKFIFYRCECANGYVVAPGNPRRCLDSDECQLVSQSFWVSDLHISLFSVMKLNLYALLYDVTRLCHSSWIGKRLGLSTDVDLYTLLMKTFPFHQICNLFPKVLNRSRSPVPALSLSRPIVRAWARPLYSARGRNSLATGL